MKVINIKTIGDSDEWVPVRATAGSSGWDLKSRIERTLLSYSWGLFPTGVFIELPVGWEAQTRSRSGKTLKEGLVVMNGIGTIDYDYRGEIGVILYNASGESRHILAGDKIAQLVFKEVPGVLLNKVSALGDTDRGEGGFGHTG